MFRIYGFFFISKDRKLKYIYIQGYVYGNMIAIFNYIEVLSYQKFLLLEEKANLMILVCSSEINSIMKRYWLILFCIRNE
jgi:hypothetical protein